MFLQKLKIFQLLCIVVDRDYENQPEFEIYFDYYLAKPVMFIFEIDPWGSGVMADIWANSKKYQAIPLNKKFLLYIFPNLPKQKRTTCESSPLFYFI